MVLYYFLHMSAQIMSDREIAIRGSSEPTQEVKFSGTWQASLNINKMRLLACNSQYCFFYDGDNEKAVVVQRTDIKSIELGRTKR